MNSSQMETKHNTQTFFCDMQDFKVVNKNIKFNFTLHMKIASILEIK
jgi:hypothetical protein